MTAPLPPPSIKPSKPAAVESSTTAITKSPSDLRAYMLQREKKHFHVVKRAKNGGRSADEDVDEFWKYWEGELETRKAWFAEKRIDGDNPEAAGYKAAWYEYYDFWKQRWQEKMQKYEESKRSGDRKGKRKGDTKAG
jgi:hypothetical protein